MLWTGCCVESTVDVPGEGGLEAATDIAQCPVSGGAAFDVGAGAEVHAHAGDNGHAQGAVERLVLAAVDAAGDGVYRWGRDGVDAGEAGEGGFGSDAAQV